MADRDQTVTGTFLVTPSLLTDEVLAACNAEYNRRHAEFHGVRIAARRGGSHAPEHRPTALPSHGERVAARQAANRPWTS